MTHALFSSVLALVFTASASACVDASANGKQKFDCSQVTLTNAFDGLIARLAAVYPYTAWRGLDWDTLKATYRPVVAQAEADSDYGAYLRALMDLGAAMHDGHMSVWWSTTHINGEDDATLSDGTTYCDTLEDHGGDTWKAADIGGGFGAGFVRDAAGDVRILGVAESVTAVHEWDKVKKINDVAVDTYLANSMSLRWAATWPAVDANIDAERLAYLSVGAAGAALKLTIEVTNAANYGLNTCDGTHAVSCGIAAK